MTKPDEQLLKDLFDATVKALTEKISNGKPTAGDIKNAIQLLKDNNVNVEVKKADPFERLKENLPFTSEPEN